MGTSLTWVAAKGATAAQITDRLGLRPTGRQGEPGGPAVVGLAVPGGWFVVVAPGSEDQVGSARSMAKLSDLDDIITGFIEDHVMASHCALWVHGRRRWRVDHRGEDGALHLSTSGRLPAVFNAIKAAAIAHQQADAGGENCVDHLVDVPLELAKSVSGFRPDEMDGLIGEVLEESAGRRMWRASRPWRLVLTLIGFFLAGGMLLGAIVEVVSWWMGSA